MAKTCGVSNNQNLRRMNSEFLRRMMWEAHYSLKMTTNTTYLLQPYMSIEELADSKQRREATAQFIAKRQQAGKAMLLPIRISFVDGHNVAPVRRSGRGMKQRVKQMKATFTQAEVSPYKIAKPYKVCTAIWEVEGHKCFFYGSIGITPAEGHNPKDNGDLVIFYTPDWKEVDVFIFRGLAQPNNIANLQEAVQYVERNVEIG